MVCVLIETAVRKGEKHGGLEIYFADTIDKIMGAKFRSHQTIVGI